MKKIALVTCYFQHNYGSQLQAYATQRFFDKLNIENETICIDGLLKEINKKKYKYFITQIFNKNIVADKLGYFKHKIAVKFKSSDFKQKIEIRNNLFNSFSEQMFNISKTYYSKKEIEKNSFKYSGFLVGSDQLWLPSNIEGDYYTLNFVPKDVPKIAYSTSFGVSSLSNLQAKKAITFLSRFDYLSVREKSGKHLIKKLINLDVPIVCDPTLLFTAEEWNTILNKERFYKEKYIFCYFLGNNPSHREFAKKLKKKIGYKIVQLQHMDKYIKSDEKFPDYAPYNVGSKEFVQLIRDAEYVLTDSFHCSVFSILFKKNFFIFKRYGRDSKNSTNSRIYSLIKSLRIENRLCNNNANVEEVLLRKFNYKQTFEQLDEIKKNSISYLETVIKDLK